MLFSLCDPARSLVEDDRREPFYSLAERYSNLHAVTIGAISGYGHYFKSLTTEEVTRWENVIIRDGCIRGGDGDLYRQWSRLCSKYDAQIANSMARTQLCPQIKQQHHKECKCFQLRSKLQVRFGLQVHGKQHEFLCKESNGGLSC